MTRDDAIERLAALKPWLATRKVAAIAIFGSVARDEAGPDSDLDLLVEFTETPGLIAYAALQRELSERLGLRVDLVTARALHPLMRDDILGEAIHA